ncbi:MAG TPA: TolC family protein [Atribacterota bacterium]|nr:TolC family protein [Atribacterota bacterium]
MRYYYINRKDIIARIACFLLSLLLLSCSGILYAQEISPEEALQWGIQHNYDLQNLRYSIDDIKRNLEIIDAGNAFQVDLDITPIWSLGGKGDQNPIEMEKNRFAPETELSLSAKKQLAPDLSLTSKVTWQSENIAQSFPENITKEVKGNIRVDKKLYPATWSEQEKQVYALENSLEMKLAELRWKEVEKQIEFIQKYLAIVRLQKQLETQAKRLGLAEEDLARVRAQIEIGEGGYQREAEAAIALEEVKNKVLSATQELSQAEQQWFLQLGLPAGITVSFVQQDNFLKILLEQMDDLPLSTQSHEKLIEQALQENYQIKNNLLEKEELLKELQWTKDAGKPALNLSGGYSYPDDDWFIMFDFSVNLADGGVQRLKEQQKEDGIRRKEISMDYLKETLKLEAEQLLNQDYYNQLLLQTQQLALAKELDKVTIIEQQYQKGAISQTQRDNSLLALEEKELSVRQAQDQWLVDRLKLAHFIGYLPKGV